MTTEGETQTREQLHQKLRSQLYGIDISFTVLAIIAVGLRFWARHRSTGSRGWDDWLVLLALIALFVSMGMNVIMIENGLGLQAEYVSLEQTILIGKALFVETINYLILLCLVKLAIIVLYCRVFPLRGFRIVSLILGWGIGIWTFMFVLLCIFQCKPVKRAWDPTAGGKCLNLKAGYIGNAIPNILTDVFILAMPLRYIWSLHIRLAQRLAVTGIFLLGIFVIIASTYRFTRILKLDVTNLSYTLKQPATWSHVELSTATICACLPVMRPLLTSLLNLFGLNHKSSQQSGSTPHAGTMQISIPSARTTKKRSGITLTEVSMADEREDGWTALPEIQSHSTDELPLNAIHVSKKYVQEVETSSTAEPWLDERKKRAWYPGS